MGRFIKYPAFSVLICNGSIYKGIIKKTGYNRQQFYIKNAANNRYKTIKTLEIPLLSLVLCIILR